MATEAAVSRIVEDKELPPAGRWWIDTSHSEVSFVARHMMISKVRGRFRDFTGVIDIGDEPTLSSVEVTINAASIDTGDPDRDRHLCSPDFLDVERYPHITFRSTSVREAGDEKWAVAGDLMVRGVTKRVTLSVEYCGLAHDLWGNVHAGFLATTEINREDFEVSWNQTLRSGGFLVGKGVKVELDIEAVHERGD
jgi:polyisoprenoid-binding protein YceI